MEILTAENAVKFAAIRKGKAKEQTKMILVFLAANLKAIKDACKGNDNLGVFIHAKEIVKENGISGGYASVYNARKEVPELVLMPFRETVKNAKNVDVARITGIRVFLA